MVSKNTTKLETVEPGIYVIQSLSMLATSEDPDIDKPEALPWWCLLRGTRRTSNETTHMEGSMELRSFMLHGNTSYGAPSVDAIEM